MYLLQSFKSLIIEIMSSYNTCYITKGLKMIKIETNINLERLRVKVLCILLDRSRWWSSRFGSLKIFCIFFRYFRDVFAVTRCDRSEKKLHYKLSRDFRLIRPFFCFFSSSGWFLSQLTSNESIPLICNEGTLGSKWSKYCPNR